jgi:hypothetical protein
MDDETRPAGRIDDARLPAGGDGIGSAPGPDDRRSLLADDRPAEELPERPAISPRASPQPWIVVALVLLAILLATLVYAVAQGFRLA